MIQTCDQQGEAVFIYSYKANTLRRYHAQLVALEMPGQMSKFSLTGSKNTPQLDTQVIPS